MSLFFFRTAAYVILTDSDTYCMLLAFTLQNKAASIVIFQRTYSFLFHLGFKLNNVSMQQLTKRISTYSKYKRSINMHANTLSDAIILSLSLYLSLFSSLICLSLNPPSPHQSVCLPRLVM